MKCKIEIEEERLKELIKEAAREVIKEDRELLTKDAVYSKNDYEKILDKLIYDEDCDVRLAVAELGYGLDKLINDKHYIVRIAVAEQGYGLDKLVDDEEWAIRRVVAEQLEINI